MPLFRTPLVSKDQPVVILTGPNAGCITPYFQTVLLSISGFADTGAAATPDVTQLTTDVATLNGQMTALTLVVAGKLSSSAVSAFGLTLIDDANAAAARTTLGIGNVENKSSATIRGEITAANVNAALTYTAADDAAVVKLTGAQTVAGIKTWTNGDQLGSTSGPTRTSGTGTPEGVVTAPVSSTFQRTDGGAGTCFYVKESGVGNTGWVAK